MRAPTEEMAGLLRRSRPEVAVYLYEFNHVSSAEQQNWQHQLYHGLELYYVFGAPFYGLEIIYAQAKGKEFTDEDREMSKYTMRLWTDFTKYG